MIKFNSKLAISFLFCAGASFAGHLYTGNLIENKIKVSMENHNKNGEVFFDGKPVVNIAFGTLEIQDFKIKVPQSKMDLTGDFKVTGLNYYNYLLDKDIFTDNVVLHLNGLNDSLNKQGSNGSLGINKSNDSINIDYVIETYNIESKNSATQAFYTSFSGVPSLYDSLNKELSSIFTKGSSFKADKFKNILFVDQNTATLKNINYTIINKGLLSEMISEGKGIEEGNKRKNELLSGINQSIDLYKLNSINPDIKELTKKFVLEEKGEVELSVINKTDIKLKDLIMKALISKDPFVIVKENYEVSLK